MFARGGVVAKRIAAYAILFSVTCLLLFSVIDVATDDATVPVRIEAESECPVVQGCATGQCHGFDNVPVPDGVHEMKCPEDGCSSVDCHGWNALSDGYRQASNMSLTVWILVPAVFVCIAIVTVRRSR